MVESILKLWRQYYHNFIKKNITVVESANIFVFLQLAEFYAGFDRIWYILCI